MGKKMDKADVIYGESHNQPLKSWNKWSDVEALLNDRIGPNAKVDWNAGKNAVKQAQADKGMVDAYIKIGLIGNDLVLRAKAKKFFGDKEIDAVLVKNYKSLAAQYNGSAQKIEDKGREIVINELPTAKKREEVYSALKSLGASKSEVESLHDTDTAYALFKRLNIDRKIAGDLHLRRILLSEKGYAMLDLSGSRDRKELYLMLVTCGAKASDLAALDSPDALQKLCNKLGIPGNTTSWLMGQTWALSDRGAALVELEKIPAAKDISNLLKKAGMKPSQIKGLYQEGGSIENIAQDLVAFGISPSAADTLAGLIVDSSPDTTDQQLIDKLPSISDPGMVGKVLDHVGMKAWRKRVSDGVGVDLDSAAQELAEALGISDKEASRITEMFAP